MKREIACQVTERGDGCTVQDILREELHLTGHQIRSAKYRSEGIRLNGRKTRITQRVARGDTVTVLLEEEGTGSFRVEAAPGDLDILYEDEDLIVVNKPPGLVVHPANGHYRDTLANYLAYYFQENGQTVRIRAIGRLDKDTSGIMVFAKNNVAAARLSEDRRIRECYGQSMAQRANPRGRMEKEYLALVQGHLAEPRGYIELPIAASAKRLNYMEIADRGRASRTWYELLEEGSGHSLLRVWLDTGRTHQIRVHMAAMGHPLAGDPVYGCGQDGGGIQKTRERTGLPGDPGSDQAAKDETRHEMGRTALHCSRVCIRHPFTERNMEFYAPLPEDMKKFWKKFQKGNGAEGGIS